MVFTVLWESQPATPHLLPKAFLESGITQLPLVWLQLCHRGRAGSGELTCTTVTWVMFPSMSVRRGDICLCTLSSRGSVRGLWAAGVRRGAALMYPGQGQPATTEPGQGRDWAFSARGARPELEKFTCKRNTKTLPAAGSNLPLLKMVVNKKLVVNTEVSFSLIFSSSQGHPPSQSPTKQVWGVALDRIRAVARPQRHSTAYLMLLIALIITMY